MEHGNMTDIDWKSIRISDLEDKVKELEAEKAELIQTLKDANDTLRALLEMASNEIWDTIGGQAYGAVSEQVEDSDKVLSKMKEGE